MGLRLEEDVDSNLSTLLRRLSEGISKKRFLRQSMSDLGGLCLQLSVIVSEEEISLRFGIGDLKIVNLALLGLGYEAQE